MNRFLEHLKEKGYGIIGEEAILSGIRFKIKSGNIQRATGLHKYYWLELK